MKNMIFGEKPSFNEIVETPRWIEAEINALIKRLLNKFTRNEM